MLDLFSLDKLDKLSDSYCMSIKNAPPKWNEISAAAKACGAGEWAMRKWLERCDIPDGWKLKIFRHSGEKISFDDMEIVAANTRSETAA